MPEQVLLTRTTAHIGPMQDKAYPEEQQPTESSCWSREKQEDEEATEWKCYILTAIPHSPYLLHCSGLGGK